MISLVQCIQDNIGFHFHTIINDDTGEVLFDLDNKENNPTEEEKQHIQVEVIGRIYDDKALWVKVVDWGREGQ